MALFSVISTMAYAIDKVDGIYQLGSADDLKEFAALVNDGETFANAALTADINLGTELVMIGTDANRFRGIFDGKGHTVTINFFPKADGNNLFRNIDGNALIQNLKVQGKITTNNKYAAGIAGWGRGTIRNCWVDLTIQSSFAGDATHGGFVGVASEGLVLENCLSHITINGEGTENCGGLCGWTDGKVTASNCLVINDGTLKVNGNCGTIARNPGNLTVVNLATYKSRTFVSDAVRGANYNNYAAKAWGNTDKVSVDAEGIKSGKVCYQLNNDQTTIAWVQNLGEDEYPVPAVFAADKKQVYASAHTGCNGQGEGEITYSNEGTVDCDAHATDANGVCPVCGHMAFEVLPRDYTDNSFIVSKPEDIDWLEGLNKVNNGGWFNISLANDVEYIPEEGQGVFNMDNWFGGIVDGRGHTLTFEIAEVDNETAHDGLAFIPRARCTIKNIVINGTVTAAKNDAAIVVGQVQGKTTLENVEVHGSVTAYGQYSSTVAGALRNGEVIMNNVFSDADFHSKHTGDNTSGGIVGLPDKDWRLTNVIYAGNIDGIDGAECIGSFAGWSSGNGHLTNVAFLGTMQNVSGDSHPISRNPGKVNFYSKFYYVNDFPEAVNAKTADNERNAMEQVAEEDVESGRLAFLLNGNVQGGENFYQVIGTDPMPKPFAKEGGKVYAVSSSYRCDGTPLGDVTYSNDETGSLIPDHQFEYGFCTECGGVQEDFMTPAEDGVYEISNADELIWWSHFAAEKNLGASARLVADIDVAEANSDKAYALIGTEAAPFYGSFDGQFHTISNLEINYSGNRGVGLIGVMNSRAAKNDGVSDADARAAEGTFIKDVVMDETCSIIGGGYAGLVGMTAEWAGHVTFQNVGLDCDVRCTTGANAGGVLGCVMGSTCHITIDNCYMTGNVYGVNENGAFSGWLGSYAEIKNCYAIGVVEKPESEDNHKYFARYGTAKITNCYSLHGGEVNDADHFVGKINEGDIATGALCYLLNGKQFRTSYYYQTIDEDAHPVANPAHGVVVFAAEQYFTVTEETISDVTAEIADFYQSKIEDVIANQEAIDELAEAAGLLTDVETLDELADMLDEIHGLEDAVNKSAEAYAKFQAKVEETLDYLAEHDDFAGEDRDALEVYLENDAVEILEARELTNEELEEEIAKIDAMLEAAINHGYIAGTDITKLLVNGDFSLGKDTGWKVEGKDGATGHATANGLYGIESWSSKPFIMSQDKEGMKPGYYLVALNGAYRPQNNRYSYNHNAYFSVNGVTNYLQTVIEDKISAEEAIDGVNANITGPTADLGVSSDMETTDFNEDFPAEAYVVHGPYGLAVAASAGRYQNYVAALVGEDGKFNITIANPHSKVGTNEWTGASNLHLIYLGEGEDAQEGLAKALESQVARANCILENYIPAGAEDARTAPNFPAALMDALSEAVETADAAATVEEQMAAIETLSQLFQDIHAGKEAYAALAEKAMSIESVLAVMDDFLTDDEYNQIYDEVVGEIYELYESGSLSTEDALAYDLTKIPALAKIIAPQDENGTYQLSEALHLVYFGAIVNGNQNVNAVLTKDIDMTGINFAPIGGDTHFMGTFDGQHHAIKNLVIGDPDMKDAPESASLFRYVENATIKNVKIQSTVNTGSKFAAGLVGKAYGSTTRISDCDVDLTVNSTVSGDGTHGGIIGVNEGEGTVTEYCKVHFTLNGAATECWGGVIGWSTSKNNVNNTLVIANVIEANMSGSNSISRNDGNCTCSNVYFTTKLNGAGIGTYVDPTSGQLESGELTYKLNGSSSSLTSHWRQTLGEDSIPMLGTGKVVYKYGGEYTNEIPDPQLNAFAYNLNAATSASDVTIAYSLNAKAKSVKVNFYDGDTKVASVPVADVDKGNHIAVISNSELGVAANTVLSYEVEVDGIGTKESKRMNKLSAWSPYGIAVNNTPSSPGFGSLYVIESDPGTPGMHGYVGGSQPYISDVKHGGLYVFTPDFEPVLAEDGEQGFHGGLDLKLGISPVASYANDDLKTIRVSKDGRVFVARANGIDASPIYEINPADLNADWSPVFTGGELDETTGITYVGGEEQTRIMSSFGVEGEGENLKLWTLAGGYSDGGFNYSDYVCNTYNLGAAAHWTTTPSSTVDALTGQYTIAPRTVAIMPDQRGGVWYVQYRANPSALQPAIKHVNADGVEDYSDISTVCAGAGLAVSSDGDRIAVITNTTGKIVVYDVNYIPNEIGEISLNPVAVVQENGSTHVNAIDFDYAGNLVTGSAYGERVAIYAVPYRSMEPVVTPAAAKIVVGTENMTEEMIDAINGVNALDAANGAIYNIAGQRAAKAQNGIFIQNGKKVSVK